MTKRFVADHMLKRLARWLRAAGYDVEWLDAPEPLARVLPRIRRDDRVLLTRTRRGVPQGDRAIMVFESEDLVGQLGEFFGVHGPPSAGSRFSRCTLCNVLLLPVEIEKVRSRLPRSVREWCRVVWTCPNCSRLYWDGSHVGSMERILDEAASRARRSWTPSPPRPADETVAARSWDRYDEFLRRLFGEHDRAWRGFRRKRRSLRPKFLARMGELGLSSLDAYADYIRAHPSERKRLNETLSVTVSRFFRDREEWSRLRRHFGDLVREGRARAWSVGCASGEEPFTLRICWEDWRESSGPDHELRILATDVSDVCLRRAGEGIYPEGAVHSVPAALREKFFRSLPGDLFELDPRTKNSVEFSKVDLLEDSWPEGRFDLIMCRNFVFTYLEGDTLRRIGHRLAQCLREEGILMVGSNEGRRLHDFGLLHLEGCLWRRTER